ncbi:little elongation complex subunit 2 [Bombina bombina]|uniref:little elongation complex subunit 2 n=1 Tax=Bombina bombina TaxID=8345 RepID=UPI00235B2356|nr:little elongation complex subunit 2 [Bombina bombina]
MEGDGELKWDIEPYNGRNCFFTRESFEKYSLGPTFTDIWHLITNAQKAPEETLPAQKNKEKSPPTEPATEKPEVQHTVVDGPSLPEPRVPYPHYSCISEHEQKMYVQLMIKFYNTKNSNVTITYLREYNHYQFLKTKLANEYAEFQKYLQNSARNCVEDYNWLSTDAQLFTQDLLKACQMYVKNYPELYAVHKITSLLGGKFKTDLALKLEKCLLKMGSASYVKVIFPSSGVDLPTESSTMSSAKTADFNHESVMSDLNASRLAAKYCPQIVMTGLALYTLLNNHGVGYKEQWEIPLRVETIATEDKNTKVIYLDSPLPKKELSVREQSQMFHEVCLNIFMVKKSVVFLKTMQLDKSEEQPQTTIEDSRSKREDVCNMEVDFETDVTELETFGSVEKMNKKAKPSDTQTSSPDCQTCPPASETKPLESSFKKEVIVKSLVSKLKMEKEVIKKTIPEKQNDQEMECPAPKTGKLLWSDTDEGSSFDGFDSDEISNPKKNKKGSGTDSDKESKTTKQCTKQHGTKHQSDSEEDRLVIDIESDKNSKKAITASPKHNSVFSPPLVCTPDSQHLQRKQSKTFSKEFDPVGQILKMQTQLLKPEAKKMHNQNVLNAEKNEQLSQNPLPNSSQPSSSIIPMVQTIPEKMEKKFLTIEEQARAEDETEYTAPLGDNCTYKLFSLDDLLLLIKSPIQKAKVRTNKKGPRKHTPIHVLAKMNYQSCYGAEALTESESCRLWTESLLNSNSAFYIGHIDAFTSKLFMLEEITSESLKERISNLKSMNSLNILYHILKWVTELQDGSYLLSHVSDDSSVRLYKSLSRKDTRVSYNLHEAHNSLPKTPSSLSVPWVPLDPNILLPYHIHHGRPPCTFPPPIHENKAKAQVNRKRQTDSPKQAPEEVKPAAENSTQQTAKKKKGNKKMRPHRVLKWKTKIMSWKALASAQKKSNKGLNEQPKK